MELLVVIYSVFFIIIFGFIAVCYCVIVFVTFLVVLIVPTIYVDFLVTAYIENGFLADTIKFFSFIFLISFFISIIYCYGNEFMFTAEQPVNYLNDLMAIFKKNIFCSGT